MTGWLVAVVGLASGWLLLRAGRLASMVAERAQARREVAHDRAAVLFTELLRLVRGAALAAGVAALVVLGLGGVTSDLVVLDQGLAALGFAAATGVLVTASATVAVDVAALIARRAGYAGGAWAYALLHAVGCLLAIALVDATVGSVDLLGWAVPLLAAALLVVAAIRGTADVAALPVAALR